ncbi:MAG: twitching motility protein PilT, partial [Gaiellaceae bacterium]
VRNLIRQAKVEQIYSVMQTNTSRGMQTLEQALLDLVRRGKISKDLALMRSSKPDQLKGLLQRHGLLAADDDAPAGGLRVAGS